MGQEDTASDPALLSNCMNNTFHSLLFAPAGSNLIKFSMRKPIAETGLAMDRIWFVSVRNEEWDQNKDERVSTLGFAWIYHFGAAGIRLRGEGRS
jgi:hypothetical protein